MLRRRGGDSDEEKPERLRIRPVLAQVAAGYRYDWKLLLGAGLLVFGAIGLITAFDALDPNTIDDWSGGWSVVLALLIVAQLSVPLLGAVFYSGVVAAGVEQRRSGVRHGIADVARSLPYRALIVADIALFFLLLAPTILSLPSASCIVFSFIRLSSSCTWTQCRHTCSYTAWHSSSSSSRCWSILRFQVDFLSCCCQQGRNFIVT